MVIGVANNKELGYLKGDLSKGGILCTKTIKEKGKKKGRTRSLARMVKEIPRSGNRGKRERNARSGWHGDQGGKLK